MISIKQGCATLPTLLGKQLAVSDTAWCAIHEVITHARQDVSYALAVACLVQVTFASVLASETHLAVIIRTANASVLMALVV